MNESVDAMNPLDKSYGRKRRTLAGLASLSRTFVQVAFSAVPLCVPATFATRDANPALPASLLRILHSDQVASDATQVSMILGLVLLAWAAFCVYITGLGSVEDKKAAATLDLVCAIGFLFLETTDPVLNAFTKVCLAAAVLDLLVIIFAGAGPKLVRVSSNAWLRLNAGEDVTKDALVNSSEDGEVTVIRRINSHAQLISKSKAS